MSGDGERLDAIRARYPRGDVFSLAVNPHRTLDDIHYLLDRVAKMQYAWDRWSQAGDALQNSGQGKLGTDLFDDVLPLVIAKAQRADALAERADTLAEAAQEVHAAWEDHAKLQALMDALISSVDAYRATRGGR